MRSSKDSTLALLVILASLMPLTAASGQSAYRLDPGVDLPVVGGIAAAGGLALWLRSGTGGLSAGELDRLDRGDVLLLDRWVAGSHRPSLDEASDVGLALCLLSPALLATWMEGPGETVQAAILYAESLGLALSATYVLKELTGRVRPYAYREDLPLPVRGDPDARRSFPSGHAAASFTAAAFLTTVYADHHPASSSRTVVGGLAFGTAAAVALLRVESGQHFPTDAAAGALVGTAAGWLVPRMHRRSSGRAEGIRVVLLPGWAGITLPLSPVPR